MTHAEVRRTFHAEPVSASRLTRGEVYFRVDYFDDEMLVPVMKSLVFLGRDVMGARDNDLYFQDLESFLALGTGADDDEDWGPLYRCADDQLTNIFALDKAIDEFQRCNVRRHKAQAQNQANEEPSLRQAVG